MSLYFGKVSAMPLVLAAAVITVMSFRHFKHSSERARRTKALKASGAQSYLGFHLQRVNGLSCQRPTPQSLMRAAEEHRVSTEACRRHLVASSTDVGARAAGAIDSAARQRHALSQHGVATV